MIADGNTAVMPSQQRRVSRAHWSVKARGLGLWAALAAVAACAPETSRRTAGARDADSLARAGTAPSPSSAAVTGTVPPARGPDAGIADPLASPADTIAVLDPPGAPARAFPEPDRPVAKITTDTWSNEATRDKAGEAKKVMELLGIRDGMRVADIGAGSGYYTARLSRAVGPAGRVVGQDIVRRYLEKLRERVQREDLTNVILALGEPHDPRLPPGSVDLALLVHMYHEVEQPYGLLYNLYPALRHGGRVAVVDLNRPTSSHGTPPELLRCEFEAVGYRRIATHELGPRSGYLAIFSPPPSRAGLEAPESIEACEIP